MTAPSSNPQVHGIFDPATWTITYVVHQGPGTGCAIIDSVLDYDPKSGRTSTESADKVIAFVHEKKLTVQWILETHAHADHLWGVIDDFDTSRYPGAPHLMSAAELDYWRQPDLATRLPDAFQAMAAGTARRLRMIDDILKPARPGDEIAPGVSLVDTSGHTPGRSAGGTSGGYRSPCPLTGGRNNAR